MPKCLTCGNVESFGSSRLEPLAPTANPIPTALLANFDEHGYIDTLENMGTGLEKAQEAWENPEVYFDFCTVCGSKEIQWP
ncbi:MAG: hypothetical protein ACYDG6_13805 [Thermincolia bacterium]